MTHPLPNYPPPSRYEPPLRAVPDEPQPTTQQVQAAAEGAVVFDDTNSIEFLGKRFGLAERIALMPLLAFANAGKNGVGADDMDGLAAMYRLIRSCLDRTKAQAVDPETGQPQVDENGAPVLEGRSQWELFEEHADEQSADGEELNDFIRDAIQVVSARPRKRRGDSSGSSPRTLPSLRESSSSPDIRPAPGRVPPGFEDMVSISDLGR